MTKLSDFIKLQKLGEGSFGVVDLYREKKTKKLVAIKRLPKKKLLKNNANGVRNTIREVELMKKIGCHPTVICYDGWFENKTYIYVVMEYFIGYEVFDVMKCMRTSHYKLNDEKIRKFIKYMADALYFLHSNGIVHRDIKDENVMYNTERLILIDMNVMCEKMEKDCLDNILGNAMFMAPEIHQNILDRTNPSFSDYAKADVFAMGGVIWELCFGTEPDELFRELEHYNKPSWISTEVYDILLQMLEKNPKNRIDSKQLNILVQNVL